MKPTNPLFSDKYLSTKFQVLELSTIRNLEEKFEQLRVWKESIRNQSIIQGKEESLKGEFLTKFFVDVLNYNNQKDSGEWFLEIEQKTPDGKKMDGALGFFKIENKEIQADVRVVIEIKDAKTDLDKPQSRKNDNRTPVQQAFDYANSLGGSCRWIIVSNFLELRLYYQTDRTRYQYFDLQTLDRKENFKQFYFLLNKDRLITRKGDSITDKLYFERQAEELTISNKFYADYKQARLTFFNSLKSYHPTIDELVLLNKTQKLLDRLLFVHFCEDYNIIESYTLRNLITNAKKDLLIREKNKIYIRICALFSAINQGYPEIGINKFNGGLFEEDEILNNLVPDDVILKPILALIDYDFASDLNVNILGHIFEQSISDIEELKADISGEQFDKKQGKRKKEGIYYTPDYITRYIVEEAIGDWLKEKRLELNEESLPELTDEDFNSIHKISRGKNKLEKKIQQHIEFYEAYKKILSEIKILDPACGSGAFLNQAFDFLYAEGQRVNHELVRLRGGQMDSFDLNKHILEKNLFGVDLNPESVEITKLSLWLKTANAHKELTSLDNNIKCGNSLIDDPNVAGEKAFIWKEEFKQIIDQGGFDVIIGNPPYATGTVLSQLEKEFYLSNFITAQYQLELYILFIEKAISLLSINGDIAFITPNSWLKNLMMSECRKLMLDNLTFNKIIPNIPSVFEDASVDTLMFIANKSIKQKECAICSFYEKEIQIKHFINQERFLNNHKYIFDLEITNHLYNIFSKITENCLLMSDLFHIISGIRPYDKYTGQSELIIKEKAYHADYKKDNSFVPELRGKHINRYFYQWDNKHYISYGDWLAAPREAIFFEGERIIFREILGKTNFICTLINENFKIDRSLYIALPKENNTLHIKYVLALLASKFLCFYFRYINNEFDLLFPKIRVAEFSRLPIKVISQEQQQPFIEKADLLINKNKELQELKNKFLRFIQAELKPQKLNSKLQNYEELTWSEFKEELKKAKVNFEKLSIKSIREWQEEFDKEKQQLISIKIIINQTDNDIDMMVYRLYGLDDNEINYLLEIGQ